MTNSSYLPRDGRSVTDRYIKEAELSKIAETYDGYCGVPGRPTLARKQMAEALDAGILTEAEAVAFFRARR